MLADIGARGFRILESIGHGVSNCRLDGKAGFERQRPLDSNAAQRHGCAGELFPMCSEVPDGYQSFVMIREPVFMDDDSGIQPAIQYGLFYVGKNELAGRWCLRICQPKKEVRGSPLSGQSDSHVGYRPVPVFRTSDEEGAATEPQCAAAVQQFVVLPALGEGVKGELGHLVTAFHGMAIQLFDVFQVGTPVYI